MNKKQSRLVMLGLLLGVLLEALDGTVVGTAMPRVVGDLGGISLLGWVFSAYILTSTVTTPIYGKLSDLYGRMPFYLGGMAIFMAGSVACGFAQDMTQLVIFRGVQGLGAGAMMPVAIAIGRTVFPPEDRGKIQAAISGAFGIASVFGPTLGGFIVDNFNWRWVFFFTVPVGLLAVVLLYVYLPEAGRRNMEHTGQRSIDLAGAGLLVVGATALMLGFQWGGDSTMGWTSWQALGSFGLALAMLVGFVLVERQATDPIVPLNTFRNSTFSLSILISFLVGAVMIAILSYLPLFMQAVLGISATNSGTSVTPMMLALVVGTTFTGRTLGTKIEQYKWMGLLSAGMMLVATLLMVTLDVNSAQWQVILYMVLFGSGLGICFTLYSIVVSTTMERRYLGVALGLVTFFRSLGNALSVALFGSILAGQLKTEIAAGLQRLPANDLAKLPLDKLSQTGPNALADPAALAGLRQGLNQLDGTGQLFNSVIAIFKEALSNSIHTMFVGGAIIAVLALLATLALKNGRINFAKLRAQAEAQALAARQERVAVEA